MIATTFTALRKAHACSKGYRKLAEHLGSVDAYGANTPIPVSVVLESNGLDDALWVLRNAALEDVQPLMVTWGCDCAERVLPVWDAKYPNDRRPHDAVAAARNWVGNPCEETRQAVAYAAARAAADAACAAADAAAYTAADAADAAAYAACATYDAARAAYAANAARAAADAARSAYDAERDWQVNRLKELLG
jgi:hypothetical protein